MCDRTFAHRVATSYTTNGLTYVTHAVPEFTQGDYRSMALAIRCIIPTFGSRHLSENDFHGYFAIQTCWSSRTMPLDVAADRESNGCLSRRRYDRHDCDCRLGCRAAHVARCALRISDDPGRAGFESFAYHCLGRGVLPVAILDRRS